MKFLRKHIQTIALYTSANLVLQLIAPTVSWALTGGPSQPETQQFAPAGLDNMVDPFTGDFSYNIPLMDVGGYPINLNYASGISTDAEASWVGLGWNLNVGAINRSVRGIPDDFAGDEISKDYTIEPNQTFGVSGNVKVEAFGFEFGKIAGGLGASANLFYNNYNGFGMGIGLSPSVSAGENSKSPLTAKMGLSTSLDSEKGLEVNPTAGLGFQMTDKEHNNIHLNVDVGFPYSTREGLKGMSMSGAFSYVSSGEYKKGGNTYVRSLAGDGHIGTFQGFASPTYTPSLEHEMYNVNASVNIGFSATNPATEPSFGFGGYYSGQFLKSNNRSAPSYGYMYSGLNNSDNTLLDFNREKDGLYNEFTQNLAVTNFTYDIFQVNGQGIGGIYRLHRGDVGTVHDPRTSDQGYSPSLGIEIGGGGPPSAKVGVDADFNYTQSFSGPWPDDRGSLRSFQSQEALINRTNEYAYFKKIGEPNPENDVQFSQNVQKGYNTIRHDMDGHTGTSDGKLNGKYKVFDNPTSLNSESSDSEVEDNNFRTARRNRSTSFTTLTVEEAKNAAVSPLYSYDYQNFNWGEKDYLNRSFDMSNPNLGYSKTTIARDTNGRKPHHISEIRVTDNKGARYVYGIPVYNNTHNEVSFSLPQADVVQARKAGYVEYTDHDDNVDNSNGDHYYNKISTPPYATSYLLSAVLSSDYVDRDGIPGPSDGDLGNYTKFNYTRAIENYPWRSPLVEGKKAASFTEGLNSKPEDDKANYVYGTKEVWYLHSIETRTHVAEFYLMEREDGLGADKDGNIDGSNPLQALKKIVLYSKTDKYNSEAESIKTVHFKYDYSLCRHTPNSNGTVSDTLTKGKLTLKEVWFTFGNSNKGLLNPYKFSYADQDFDGHMDAELNPDYDARNYDKWGNFKQNDPNQPNVLYPYTVQDSLTAGKNAAVFALSSIKTPTGGTLRVYYEADDYAYVQNRQAMRMYKILGAVTSEGEIPSDSLYNSELNDKLFLVVDLDKGYKPANVGTKDVEFQNKYLSGFDMVYYKVLQEVVASSNSEYVPGYFEIDKAASKLLDENDNGVYKKALIKIKPVNPQNGKSGTGDQMNPIVRNGWMFARLRLNRELMSLGSTSDNGLIQTLKALLSEVETVKGFMLGFTEAMKEAKHSKRFVPASSFVRLNDHDKKKYGGGHRVKAIVMEDNWSDMKSSQEKANTAAPEKEENFYGQSYDYTYKETNGDIISSGVAAWEPFIGGDENPFRLPVFVREKVPLAPSKEYFLEEPFGESFFPAPVVGYRKIKITPLKITKDNLTNKLFTGNGTGYVQHESYTAYDFPTITRRTDLKREPYRPNIVLKFLKIDARDLVTCSQGYYVELNDMHGKPKAQRVYPEYTLGSNNQKVDNAPISEVEYRYMETAGRIESNVPYVGPGLDLINDGLDLGTDVDVVEDERYVESTTMGGGLQVNLKYVQFGIIPIFVVTGFPDINYAQTRFRSIVTTKVVNRTGILKSTTVKESGASIVTENLAWDQKSGEVLLTKVQNEFHDPIYNFTFPAHWAYDKMGFASREEGAVFDSLEKIKSSLTDGTELATKNGVGYFIDSTDHELVLGKAGDTITIDSKVKVIRSGARNMYDTPVGSIITLDDPRKGDRLVFTNILNAGATEFKEDWKRFCNCTATSDLKSSLNWIVSGRRGNMRPLRSLTFLTGRTQADNNNNLNIRRDGVLVNFTPFWNYYGLGKITGLSSDDFSKSQWQFVSQVENYNSTGLEIENKDALERHSMAQFGYARNLPVAISNNSYYNETGFDGFEDYDLQDCEDDHLSWRIYSSYVNNDEAHTGRKSIKVAKSSSLEIEKVIVPCYHPVINTDPYSVVK
jgi:hypothetical protein